MAFSLGTTSTTIDDLYLKVSEFDLLYYYLGVDELPCVISSPLRVDDKPSFGLFSIDGVKVRFSDLAKGDKGGLFDLFMQLWNLNIKGTIAKIEKDLPNMTITKSQVDASNFANIRRGVKTDSTLNCKVRKCLPHDIEYWKSFGISPKMLKFAKVFPVSHVLVTKKGTTYTIPADKYAYVYVEHKDDQVSLKIYQPFSKDRKWHNKHDHSVWDMWNQLPETGDKLIITSSRKDAMCVWENTGIPTTSLQAESFLPKIQVIEELKNRFSTIYVFYDNDLHSVKNFGQSFSNLMAKTFDLKEIKVPDEFDCKDPSDLVKNHGIETLKQVLQQQL